MSDCYLHKFQSHAIGLRLLSQNKDGLGKASDVLDVVDELRNVFQPLSADLIIYSRDKSMRWHDSNIKPPFPHWFINVSPLPEKVIAEPCFTNPHVSQVSELSRKVIMDWIEKALNQNRGLPETHEPSWNTFFISAVRARIFDESNISDTSTFFVSVTAGDLKYPLKRRNDGYWVYAPIKHYTTQPPLSLEVTNTEGSLNITIPVHWSLWTTPDTAENMALKQALSRIINKGWNWENPEAVFQI